MGPRRVIKCITCTRGNIGTRDARGTTRVFSTQHQALLQVRALEFTGGVCVACYCPSGDKSIFSGRYTLREEGNSGRGGGFAISTTCQTWVGGSPCQPFSLGRQRKGRNRNTKVFFHKKVFFLDQMACRTISALVELTTPVTPKGEKRSFALRKVSICLLFFSRSILSQNISSA